VQKCPYCDFNSHAQKGTIPEQEYVQHLITDFEADLEKYQASIQNRPLHSIFIGGGTPSLFSAESIKLLLAEIQRRIPFSENIEITMEANPGTVEAERFKGYVDAGVTRISMGIQSFNDDKLQRLGRIHNAAEAKSAVSLAHLSWYQLTIEPNTMFAYRPPTLPDDDALWDIFEQGHQLLTEAGYQQYETSAYAKPGFQCQHNLNYWRFGDYLAIGCGAHGKLTFPDGDILRFSKTKHPKGYLRGEYLYEEKNVEKNDRAFEFFMNRFRLLEAVPKQEFEHYTGLSQSAVKNQIDFAIQQNYIVETLDSWQVTEHGKLFLNELLALFLDE